MNISPPDLEFEYQRAIGAWPFLPNVEVSHGLPAMLLFAVGSRETNLTDEVGDGGHGHGVFQLDDRSHVIPDPFGVDVQAEVAATQLAGLIAALGLAAGVAAYNAGAGAVQGALSRDQNPDSVTTGHDYSADVLARAAYLRSRFPSQPAGPNFPEETDMLAPVVDTKAQGFDGLTPNWEADEHGNTFAWNGARPLPNLNALDANHVPIAGWGPHPSGDGLVLYGADKREDPPGSGRWVRSTYNVVAG